MLSWSANQHIRRCKKHFASICHARRVKWLTSLVRGCALRGAVPAFAKPKALPLSLITSRRSQIDARLQPDFNGQRSVALRQAGKSILEREGRRSSTKRSPQGIPERRQLTKAIAHATTWSVLQELLLEQAESFDLVHAAVSVTQARKLLKAEAFDTAKTADLSAIYEQLHNVVSKAVLRYTVFSSYPRHRAVCNHVNMLHDFAAMHPVLPANQLSIVLADSLEQLTHALDVVATTSVLSAFVKLKNKGVNAASKRLLKALAQRAGQQRLQQNLGALCACLKFCAALQIPLDQQWMVGFQAAAAVHAPEMWAGNIKGLVEILAHGNIEAGVVAMSADLVGALTERITVLRDTGGLKERDRDMIESSFTMARLLAAC